jgi:hypothetical protein
MNRLIRKNVAAMVALLFCLGCWVYFLLHPERIPAPEPYFPW